jgi:glycosidase
MKKRWIDLIIILMLQFAILMMAVVCKKDDDSDHEYNGKTYVINENPFDKVPETKDITMYQVNFKAFSSTEDIGGVTDRLDSIKNMGINVIWLMPIHPIGTINSVNSPYSVQNYTEVNPSLGTLGDLRTLVSKAHDREMAVIIDWVANHTAWDNPWIQNASWYTQDDNGNIVSPNAQWQDVADLNYSNSEMRLEMIESMKYWITEANIDGFRCDAADFVPFGFWKQAIDSLNNMSGRKLILLAEGARDDHFTAGFQLNYGWDFNTRIRAVFTGSSASGLFTTDNSEYDGIPSGCHKLRFITNHDIYAWEGSVTELYGSEEGSVAAFVIVSFLNGVPLIYDGQEIACSSRISFFDSNPLNWDLNPAIYSEYRDLMSARKSLEAVKGGSITSYNNNDIAVFKRFNETDEVLVMVNVRNATINYTIPEALANTSWKNALDSTDITLNTGYSFSPYEYLILKN